MDLKNVIKFLLFALQPADVDDSLQMTMMWFKVTFLINGI